MGTGLLPARARRTHKFATTGLGCAALIAAVFGLSACLSAPAPTSRQASPLAVNTAQPSSPAATPVSTAVATPKVTPFSPPHDDGSVLLTGATAVAVGVGRNCALLAASGKVMCWGQSVPVGNGEDSGTPLDFGFDSSKAVSVGAMSVCAVTVKGTVECDGDPVPGISGATAVAVGWDYSCAIVSHGAVECWGVNEVGQLGNGTTVDSDKPVTVVGITGATAITAGDLHACAIVSGGAVRCWGHNDVGQLGNGTTIDSDIPVAVLGLIGATSIAATEMESTDGTGQTCAIVSGGITCWGIGVLRGGWTPVTMTGVRVDAISAGGGNVCAIISGGAVKCWGGAYGYGKLPDDLTGVAAVAVSVNYTCVVVARGTVRCWGDAFNYDSGG